MGSGRPKAENKKDFKTVGVPNEVHEMIKRISIKEDRTIARQLAVLIRESYQEKFGVNNVQKIIKNAFPEILS